MESDSETTSEDSMMSESAMESEPEATSEDSMMSESAMKSEPETMSEDSMMSESEMEQESVTSSDDYNSDNTESKSTEQETGINPDARSQVIVAEPQGESVEQQGKFAYGEALQKNFLFYEANRSGDLGPYHRLKWREDSTVQDGRTVGQDLEGGYFDAGDHVKFGQPMAASVNMLAWGGVEYREAYKQAGQFDELLEAVKWGTDYFLKAHEVNGDGETARLWIQVGEGQYDHKLWTSASDLKGKTPRNAFAIDAGSPGSDVAASTAGALASASMLFRGFNDVYADKLLKNAEQLFDFAETYQGKYSDSGDNPRDYSYMIGFGDKYPESPHHRGSSPNLKNSPNAEQENILYGAIVGGPDAADDYAHNDNRDDWVTNEVGTSYNAPFASALIQQYDNLGGDPLAQSELDQLMGVDANGFGI